MIFNLFKSKPTLKELIPEGFVDIHSHILPGIDDGAKDVNESVKLITEMKKIGFSKIIGTPHTYPGVYNNTNESIEKSYILLSQYIKNDITIDYASEYMADISIIKKIEEKSILCIKNKYVLLEFGFISKPFIIEDIIFKLTLNNYIPIIAHPERYVYCQNNFNILKKMKSLGCCFQLNLLSVINYYGKSTTKLSSRLLKNKMIDFVGSDIHNLNHINVFDNKTMIDEPELKTISMIADNNIKVFS